jgi:hypothetical protein
VVFSSPRQKKMTERRQKMRYDVCADTHELDICADGPQLRVRVVRESRPLNPRTEYPRLGTLLSWDTYVLGDYPPDVASPAEFARTLTRGSVAIPLRLDRDGGACETDAANANGYLYIPEAQMRALYADPAHELARQSALNALRREAREYSAYLTGDVYGYMVERWDPDVEEWEDLGSTWAFYGDDLAASGLIQAVETDMLRGWDDLDVVVEA